MSAPQKFSLGVLIIFLAFIGIGLWWFMQTSPAAPEKMATATIPAKTVVPKAVAPSTQVAMPKAPAVPAGGRAVVDDSPVTSDPQADLKTAIPDMARLVRAGNTAMFVLTYTAPDDLNLNPQFLEQLKEVSAREAANPAAQQDPSTQKMDEAFAESYAALENQTPTFNAAGDEATYMYTAPSGTDMEIGTFTNTGMQSPTTFIKINGKWYRKPPEATKTTSPAN